MKNKRNILTAFLLICCLCLSIGYAALADDLYIDGKASVKVTSTDNDDKDDTLVEKEFKEDVYFVEFGAQQNGGKDYVTVDSNKDDDDSDDKPDALLVTIPGNVLTPENKTITLNAAIKNESADYDASVTLPNGGKTSGNNFSYAIAWADNATGAQTIAIGQSKAITITITLLTTPTEDIAQESFSVNFNATAVATKTATAAD